MHFLTFLQQEIIFMTSPSPFQIGVFSERKRFSPREQILFLKTSTDKWWKWIERVATLTNVSLCNSIEKKVIKANTVLAQAYITAHLCSLISFMCSLWAFMDLHLATELKANEPRVLAGETGDLEPLTTLSNYFLLHVVNRLKLGVQRKSPECLD